MWEFLTCVRISDVCDNIYELICENVYCQFPKRYAFHMAYLKRGVNFDETRNGRRNGFWNPRWSSQVSCRMAHLERDLTQRCHLFLSGSFEKRHELCLSSSMVITGLFSNGSFEKRHELWPTGSTARSREDANWNGHRNANRNPRWWRDFSQPVKIEQINFHGISKYSFELRYWFDIDLNSFIFRGTNSNWDCS